MFDDRGNVDPGEADATGSGPRFVTWRRRRTANDVRLTRDSLSCQPTRVLVSHCSSPPSGPGVAALWLLPMDGASHRFSETFYVAGVYQFVPALGDNFRVPPTHVFTMVAPHLVPHP